jgi:hypothetical protein
MFFYWNFINNPNYTGYYKYDEDMYKKYDIKTQKYCASNINIIQENLNFIKLKKNNEIIGFLNNKTNIWSFINGNNSTYSITFIQDATFNFNTIFSWPCICPDYYFLMQ